MERKFSRCPKCAYEFVSGRKCAQCGKEIKVVKFIPDKIETRDMDSVKKLTKEQYDMLFSPKKIGKQNEKVDGE